MKAEKLRATLEAAYKSHHSSYSRARDPLSLVHRYARPADQEIAAFLAALLAYGNVRIILNSAARVLDALGPELRTGLLQNSFPQALRSFRHRFNTGEDFEVVFHWLRMALNSHGSLEGFFMAGARQDGQMRDLLASFVQRFTSQPLPQALEALHARRTRQLKYLLSDPERGSACKRLNMFLRWMVRPADGIDLGLWKSLSPAQLILPLDTHLLKTVKALKWTKSNQATWKVAESATARLREFAPLDPVRYDFALCHLSMEGGSLLPG